ncbi:P-loop ATPase [Deinococcus geothermalis DSM 11300]|uniref:P-loop ATPase n=1 Tax=Deinococcus geothermalis (strain DSM 11300 / CIP 105573 / AG-3a) TaxID=319795 RepID=Q1IXR1_DEIGD|nr:AAA family ATPase [Deinococcus geothermalis]ABF45973.1 P-loop ATPase [Deinococcus geothermalis DSM 11300]
MFAPFDHLHAGPPQAPYEQPLAELPLMVLVGVTGVGKSTALRALQAADPGARVLPDRREVTDRVMIWPISGGPVSDRAERFRLTARYREQHPGGMAHALGTLTADTRHWGERPLFDGLRGREEVEYAAKTFPRWRFVALHAPDTVRVRRLLGRADAFDRTSAVKSGDNLRAALAALPGAAAVFSPADLDTLAALEAEGHTPQDILAKTQIVVTERQHYDPDAAAAFLQTLPPKRALLLDTVALSPEQIAAAIGAWA